MTALGRDMFNSWSALPGSRGPRAIVGETTAKGCGNRLSAEWQMAGLAMTCVHAACHTQPPASCFVFIILRSNKWGGQGPKPFADSIFCASRHTHTCDNGFRPTPAKKLYTYINTSLCRILYPVHGQLPSLNVR